VCFTINIWIASLTTKLRCVLAAATIARTFLAQFPEARRGAALSTAPSCSYSPNAAPLELRGAPAALVNNANGGYVSLVVFKRHVGGGPKQLEAAVWALSTFYGVVSYHIKCSKAYMHTRMRSRTHSLLQVLNRAKPEQEGREKKLASGRAFKAKPPPPS
jgi:actin related protein 2/3 complex, subunit 2